MTVSTTTEFSSLGFDSKAQEYKVLRSVFNYIDEGGPDNDDQTGIFRPAMESYSFKTGSWKRVFWDHYYCYLPMVYVDGCFYWDEGEFIVSLDFAEEKVSTFYGPYMDKVLSTCYDPILVNFDGSLGCILCPLRENRKTFEVWVWRRSVGWRKEVNVHVSDNMSLLAFWGNDQLLFLEVVDGIGGLLAYDCTMNQLKRLDISFDPDNTEFFPYVESKLPLDEQLLATGRKSLPFSMGFIPHVRSMLTPEGQLATCNIISPSSQD